MLVELVQELKSRHVRLGLREGKLTCTAPPGVLTYDLQSQIRERKEELIELLKAGTSSTSLTDPISKIENQVRYGLSSSQTRTRMTSPTSASLPAAFMLEGMLNVSYLEDVLNQFVSRHSPLRSSFEITGRNNSQIVQPFNEFSIPVQEIAEADRKAIDKALENLQSLEMTPENGKCFHFELIKLSERKHILFSCFSPLVFDGWSFDLFWQELSEGYKALESGMAINLKELSYSYADCSAWLSERIERRRDELESFWNVHLGNELPLDVFPTIGRPDSNRKTISLPLELDSRSVTAVRNFASNQASTPQTVLLSALYVWASRLRGEIGQELEQSARDVVLGIAVEGRPDIALEDVVGPFANLILLRQGVGNQTFKEFSTAVRDEFLSAHQHQEYPVEWHTVGARPGSTRSFQIEFSFQQTTGRSNQIGSLNIDQLELRSGTSAVDFTFWVKDWGDRISGAVEFRADSFVPKEVEHWIEVYYSLVQRLTTQPEELVNEFPILDKEQQEQVSKIASAAGTVPVKDQNGHLLPIGVPGLVDGNDEFHIMRSDGSHEQVMSIKKSDTRQGIESIVQSPQSDIETRLELILRDLLGKPLSTDANFFEAGLNSLRALQFIHRCQEEMAAVISLPVLFDHPTIAELASRLETSTHSEDAETTVSLQPLGDAPPIYCICGINLYQSLATALGEDQPVYAIYIPNEHLLLAEKKNYSVEELANVYWEVIKGTHKQGPLNLLGFCFGGALAYEIGKLAKKENYDVPKLIMLDTGLSKYMRRRLPSHLAQNLPPQLRRNIKKILGKNTSKEDKLISEQNFDIDRATALSSRLNNFAPTVTYSGDVILVDSGDPNTKATWITTPMAGWDKVLVGNCQHIVMEATHGTIMNERNSKGIANQLKSMLHE